MSVPRSALARRIVVALDTTPPRVPVIVGTCGTGRTTLLRSLGRGMLPGPCEYIDIERSATTPERFLRAISGASRLAWPDAGRPIASPREAFDAALGFFTSATGPAGDPVTFLLDEVLELRMFESFPGLRDVLPQLLGALAGSRNRFVLTSRYVARAGRLLGDHASATVIPMPSLSPDDVREAIDGTPGGFELEAGTRHPALAGFSALIHALADGRAGYVAALCAAMLAVGPAGTGDPVSGLTALLMPGGRLTAHCRHCYELRLHRARGYGALKAILEILAEQQGLTLTEIAQRLGRTPGSTKDYLSWLEDVDLVAAERKRYRFGDPLMRLWVRLYCRPVPPAHEDVAREVQGYAAERLPAVEGSPVEARS